MDYAFGSGGGKSMGDLYMGGSVSTQDKTNPKAPAGTAMGTFLEQSGSMLTGVTGLSLPVLFALGFLCVGLIRYYD